ncbi:MAG: hypothetical protein EON52_19470, partial [Actinomycetales bacterium]
MRIIDEQLRTGPFHREALLTAGYSEKVLRGRRFRRLFPRVWVHVDHEMTEADWIAAARLAMPSDARVTGATRLRQLGIDVPAERLQFVVGRDLHLDLDGIDLHRTDRLPPCTDEGVSPAAAYVELCRYATVVAAIRVGDELLREEHMTLLELRELVTAEAWREGAAQAR